MLINGDKGSDFVKQQSNFHIILDIRPTFQVVVEISGKKL